jgi:mannose-6-phosphate isomerase-like protein (cupin superfamily)
MSTIPFVLDFKSVLYHFKVGKIIEKVGGMPGTSRSGRNCCANASQPLKGAAMRHNTTTLGVAIAVAFATGIVISPLAHRAISDAHAAAAPLTPAVIDLAVLKHADLPATSNPEQHSKTLIVTDNATLAIQTGNVAKHIHRNADEIQYIIEGSGSMWLGSERKDFKPGTLLIIPRGTPHQGQIVSNGPVKSIAIKIPPQAPDDTVFVD